MNCFEALNKHKIPFIVTSTANQFGGGSRYQYHLHIHEDDIDKLDMVKKETISVTKNRAYFAYINADTPLTEGFSDTAFRPERYLIFKHSHFDNLLTVRMDNYLLLHFRESKSDFTPALKNGSDVVYNYMLGDFSKYYKEKKIEKMKIELTKLKEDIRVSYTDNSPKVSTVAELISKIDSILSETLYSKNDVYKAIGGGELTRSELENKLNSI